MSATTRRYRVQIGDHTYVVTLGSAANGTRHVRINDRDMDVAITPGHPRGASLVRIDGSVHDAFATHEGNDTWVIGVGGTTYDAEVSDDALTRFRRAAAHAGASGQEVLRAPMPGLVAGVSTQAGAHLESGAPVVVLEAMKMQNELTTKNGGTVREVRVTVGEKVDKGAVLAIIDA